MGGHDSAMRAKARMQQVRKEMSERRVLRARKLATAKQTAAENFQNQGQVAEQVSKHLNELNKRRKQAGGWGTEKVERDKDFVLGFGLEGEEGQNPYAYQPTGGPARDSEEPGGLGSLADEEATADAAEAEPTPPAPPRPAPARPERRPGQNLDDDDDFSNQSSWMTNQ